MSNLRTNLGESEVFQRLKGEINMHPSYVSKKPIKKYNPNNIFSIDLKLVTLIRDPFSLGYFCTKCESSYFHIFHNVILYKILFTTLCFNEHQKWGTHQIPTHRLWLNSDQHQLKLSYSQMSQCTIHLSRHIRIRFPQLLSRI